MGIAERDYMRRDDGAPQIKWGHVLTFLAGAILMIAFSAQYCSNAAKRHLIKGSLILNVNEATAEELQTLPARARGTHYSLSAIPVRGWAFRKARVAEDRC